MDAHTTQMITLDHHIDVGVQNLMFSRSLIEALSQARTTQTSQKSANAAKMPTPDDLTKVLTAVNNIIPALDLLNGRLSGAGQSVVGYFKAITKLENNRREIDDRIILVHYLMTTAVFTLRHLARVEEPDYDQLEEAFLQLKQYCWDFGNLAALFYSLKRTARLLRWPELKDRFIIHAEQFITHRQTLFSLIESQTPAYLNEHSDEIGFEEHVVSSLLDSLRSVGKKDQVARTLVDSHGGESEVLNDEEAIGELAKKLGETVNKSMKNSLTLDLDDLISHNSTQFDRKTQGANVQITEAIVRSKEAILLQLNEGPHEQIKDEDIKAVWQQMKWRNSVKSRAFVDGINDHYVAKFDQFYYDNDREHPNRWTVDILGKVMFHSGISDAVDGDGSGFVSVTELNSFLDRKPAGWSVPEWFAFWGQGFASYSDEYRVKIFNRLQEMKYDVRHMEAGENKEGLKSWLKYVSKFLKALVSGDGNDDDSDVVDNSSEGPPQELLRLQAEYSKIEEAHIAQGLDEMIIDDTSALIQVIQHDGVYGQARLELSLLPLIYVWLGRLQQIITTAQNTNLNEQDDDQLETLGRTMMAILMLFNGRMVELMKVWRQQKIHVTGQMQTFMGGIMYPWFQESQQTNNIFQQLLIAVYLEEESEDDEVVDDTRSVVTAETDIDEGVAQNRLKGDVDQKLQRVWKRMEEVDSRLNTIETLIRAIAVQLQVPSALQGNQAIAPPTNTAVPSTNIVHDNAATTNSDEVHAQGDQYQHNDDEDTPQAQSREDYDNDGDQNDDENQCEEE